LVFVGASVVNRVVVGRLVIVGRSAGDPLPGTMDTLLLVGILVVAGGLVAEV